MTRKSIARLSGPVVLVWAVFAQPAQAQISEPVRAMIDAALATDDDDKVSTVIELAKATHPDDRAELDALLTEFRSRKQQIAAAERKRKEDALRQAGVFDEWSGNGQIGAFQSSGNSNNAGISVSLTLDRKGIAWQHRLRASMDYQRSNGLTSAEQYLAAYEPRYDIDRGLFTYALAQFERDRFQGFDSRYSISGGLGYRLLDTGSAKLSIKAGPSYRKVDYTDGSRDSSFGGLAGFDFDWNLAKNLTFTQDANLVADSGAAATVIVDSNSTSFLLVSGLEAKISDHLSTRLSYTYDYNSNPPAGKVATDTLTRFTLAYGF